MPPLSNCKGAARRRNRNFTTHGQGNIITPYAVTGIAYAVPLFVKVGNTMKKYYITVFNCVTTQAVYLKLCLVLSTDKFLLALQRFRGRRGLPNTIYTDNSQTFRGANGELREHCTVL